MIFSGLPYTSFIKKWGGRMSSCYIWFSIRGNTLFPQRFLSFHLTKNKTTYVLLHQYWLDICQRLIIRVNMPSRFRHNVSIWLGRELTRNNSFLKAVLLSPSGLSSYKEHLQFHCPEQFIRKRESFSFTTLTMDCFQFLVLESCHTYDDRLVYYKDKVNHQCLMQSHSHSQASLKKKQKS